MYVPYIRVNPVVGLENLITKDFYLKEIGWQDGLEYAGAFFSPVEPNDLGHRTSVPSGMSPKESAYGNHKRQWGPSK